MNLAEKYSKEIIKKFDLIPVYLPGTEVKPGDIIDFGSSITKKRKKPIGSFTIYGNLSDYHKVQMKITTSKSQITPNLISSKEVSVKPAISGEFPGVVEGDIKFDFTSKGAFLLYGVDAVENRIDNLFYVRDQLQLLEHKEDWDRYYIVTSITRCKKALVYASQEKGGTLVIDGIFKEPQIMGDELMGLNADVSINVKWKNKAAFSNDWDENVIVFMKLATLKKGEIEFINKINMEGGFQRNADAKISTPAELEMVNPKDLLEELSDE